MNTESTSEIVDVMVTLAKGEGKDAYLLIVNKTGVHFHFNIPEREVRALVKQGTQWLEEETN